MKVKQILLSSVLAMALGVMLLPVPASAAENSQAKIAEAKNFNVGNVDILINEDLGLIIETKEVPAGGNSLGAQVETDYSQVFELLRSQPEKTVAKQFSHNIYDRNGKLLANLISTVNGVYSQVDSWAQISSITVSGSGPYISDFSYNTSVSGADGYLYLYYSGVSAGTFHYHIYTNGTIENN